MNDVADYSQAVQVIKAAILKSQYDAARSVNEKQLMLYFGIGKYISANSRKGFWGKGAIDAISAQLQRELPGLRGFSARSLRDMRMFYEEWSMFDTASSLELARPDSSDISNLAVATAEIGNGNLAPAGAKLEDFPYKSFLGIGFERKSHENPAIGLILCKDMNKSFVDYVIQDYTKPMGVATYKTADDMPEKLRKALPPVEDLRKLLDGTDTK